MNKVLCLKQLIKSLFLHKTDKFCKFFNFKCKIRPEREIMCECEMCERKIMHELELSYFFQEEL